LIADVDWWCRGWRQEGEGDIDGQLGQPNLQQQPPSDWTPARSNGSEMIWRVDLERLLVHLSF